MLNYNKSMLWNMTKNCNFQCSYCYFPHTSGKVKNPIPTETLLNFLNKGNDTWLVGMTGGEPFIYPDFVNLCEQLTQKHYIGIDTNLSITKIVRELAARISPSRVNDIYASLHIEEREKRNGVESFIENYHTLNQAGFTVKVNYVLHPELENRYQDDVAFFYDNGVPITPRPFKGLYNNRKYPQNYAQSIKDLFSNHPDAGTKMVFNFKGIDCKSGNDLIRMEPNGTVLRCPGDRTKLGNIKTQVNLTGRATPCIVDRCPCQGINYVELNPAEGWFVEGMRSYLTGAKKNAANAFKQVLLYDSEHSSALNNIGVFAFENEDYPHAERLFSHAARLHPSIAVYSENKKLAEQALASQCPPDATPELSEIVRPCSSMPGQWYLSRKQ